ncbi:DUF3373 family protein [Caminibacter sp.]
MKKLLISTLAVGALFAAPSVEELQMQLQKQMEIIQNLQKQIQELKKSQTETKSLKEEVQQIKEMAVENQQKINPIEANNHLFWSLDLRTTYDHIYERTTDGMGVTSVQSDPMSGKSTYTFNPVKGKKTRNNIFTNRVILTGVYKPSDNLKATVRIQANNMFGNNDATNMMTNPFQNVPWIANETPDDINVRLKEAFFNYHFGPENALMFSAGRRPATNGFPANLREGDAPSSPLAHLINMEFDGFSFKIGNEALPDALQDYGTWIKFCAGRGYSSATGKWPSDFSAPYSKNDALKNMDFAGFILVPYDDGQYSLWTETVWAWHVQGYQFDITGVNSTGTEMNATASMQDFGDYFGTNIVFKADGIGDGINDFLDDTKAFVSFAYSKTKDNGTDIIKNYPTPAGLVNIPSESHSGHSWWIGADMPGFVDNDRFGINFVKGSKYWRSFTYGEDTLVGSIAAVRGKAYDLYYHHQIAPHFTAGLRYTYIKYDYPGSDGFFGVMMNPDMAKMFSYVDKATDIRAYIRYNF